MEKFNPIFPVRRRIETVEDVKTGEIILKKVVVNSGYPGEMHPRKVFIGCERCDPDWKIFSKYLSEFQELGRNVK